MLMFVNFPLLRIPQPRGMYQALCVLPDHDVTPEDVARLSPLVSEHINLLGRYAFSVPEAVTRGELRPLRNPAKVLEGLLEICLNRFSAPTARAGGR